MIQPVNALAPKVLYKGQIDDSRMVGVKKTKRNLAIVNSLGVSAVCGAVMTALSRSYTSTWRHAGICGVGTGAVVMTFLTPHMLHKSVIHSGDSFTKEAVRKGILNDPKNIESCSKTFLKKAV